MSFSPAVILVARPTNLYLMKLAPNCFSASLTQLLLAFPKSPHMRIVIEFLVGMMLHAHFALQPLFGTDCGSNVVVHRLVFYLKIKRRTKSRYKYEVRRLKRQREHIIREKIGLALSQSRHKDFWREVQKVNRSSRGNSQSTSCVDGCVRDSDISCLFEGKLKSLLNSQDDLESRSNLLTVIETSLSSDDLVSSNISPEVVSMALKRIKPGKSDGTDLFSDHFRYASSSLSDFLAKFFTVMLRHGHIPESLRDCVLQPVLKPGKDPCCSDQARRQGGCKGVHVHPPFDLK